MSRYRPPPEKSTPIITTAGFLQLKDELRDLWEVRRPEVVSALAAAAAEGDRSENAEYQYRKKQLGELDRRIRYLSKRIPELKHSAPNPGNPRRIYFGATVELEDDAGAWVSYRIVGPDEIGAEAGWISVDSPVARALIGRTIDDDISVPTPGGAKHWHVLSVRY